MALRRLGAPESVVYLLAPLDVEDEVHIITVCGVTYDAPGLEKGSEAQGGVKQGTPEGPSAPFAWLAVNGIVWTEVDRISTETYYFFKNRSLT